MQPPLIIYHDPCTDGFTAAWAAWTELGDGAEYWPASHGALPPDVSGREIHLLDYCYPRAVMETLCQRNRVSVHDHHDTALLNMEGLPGTLDWHGDKAGAEIAWRHFRPGAPVPWLVRQVAEADLGIHAGDEALRLQAVLRITPHDFRTWDAIARLDLAAREAMLRQGDALLRNLRHEAAELVQLAAPCRLHTHEGLAVNGPWWLADAAGRLLFEETGTFGMIWNVRANRVHASLRSGEKGANVAEIAEMFGGGGRTHSAAFVTDYLDVLPLIQPFDVRRIAAAQPPVKLAFARGPACGKP